MAGSDASDGVAKLRAHFLHVGKTGGSAVKSALEGAPEGAFELVLHPHATVLEQIPEGERFFFVLRDPVERFVSGFYSRQRQGQPRYAVPWTEEEALAFERFATPDALACALASEDEVEHSHALDAIRSIRHVQTSYRWWFGDEQHFESRVGDILAILWLPTLDATFPQLCARLGIDPAPPLPHDDVGAHRNPLDVDRTLSARARSSLEEWCAADRAFVARCRELPSFMTAAE